MITACFIARNEAKLLPRAIASLARLGSALSAICVLDTGSSDGTPGIAADLGARVESFTDCNDAHGRIVDFSAARNRAIDMATTEWVLIVDCDDEIVVDEPSAAGLSEFLGKLPPTVQGCMVRVKTTECTWLQVRLLRRSVRYVGLVHEYPVCAGPTEVFSGLTVQHLPDKAGKEGSEERCARILTGQPPKSRSRRDWFYLGRALLNTSQPGAAAAALEEYLSQDSGFLEEQLHAHIHLADAYQRCGRGQKAAETIAAAIMMDPRFAEPFTFAGDLHYLAGRKKHAAALYRAALALGGPPPDARLFVNHAKYGTYPRAMLAACGE